MFKQPPLSSISNIFLLPFDNYVWMACFLLILITILIALFQWILPQIRLLAHPLEAVQFVLGATCQQGYYLQTNSISGRIIIIFTFIASIALFTSYAANIVALLQSPSNAIKTIPDLINSPLRVVVQETVYNHVYYNETTDPAKIMLWNTKIKPNGLSAFESSVPIGVEKLKSGTYAFQVESHAAYQVISDTFNEHEKCGLKELPAFKLPRCTVPLRKNSRYREMIGQRILWQRETGVMNREYKRWIPQKTRCAENVGGFDSVGLIECRPAFIALSIGISFACLILILENVIWHLRKGIKFYKFELRLKL